MEGPEKNISKFVADTDILPENVLAAANRIADILTDEYSVTAGDVIYDTKNLSITLTIKRFVFSIEEFYVLRDRVAETGVLITYKPSDQTITIYSQRLT